MELKLWHDDIRPAPDETWIWTRTNFDAMQLLGTGRVVEASLDHDMGLFHVPIEEVENWEDYIDQRGRHAATGFDLVCWMTDEGFVPPKITIHSWNPPGAENMRARLERFAPECDVTVRPYGSP